MNDPIKEKKTIMIDASSLKHISCFRKFYYMVVKGYKQKGGYTKNDYAMAYGSAIHKFLEAYYKCQPIQDCVKAAIDFYKPYNDSISYSPREFRYNTNLIKVCQHYADKFPREKSTVNTYEIVIGSDDFQPHLNTNDEKTVEYKFSIVIHENDNYRLVLTGTVDLVCSYKGLELLLVDHKSSSGSTESDKVKHYFDGYCFDIQTMLYSKVYKEQLGLDYYPPILINGIFVSKPTVKAEKEEIPFDGVEIIRSGPISFTEKQMEQFNYWFDGQVKYISDLMDGHFEGASNIFDLSQCKIGGSHCQYFDICKLPIEFHESVLKARCEEVQYNPLKFR